jgi:hypothetical protein
MVEEKTWNEFRKSSLLLFVNQFLHIFGWAIVFEFDNYDSNTDDGVITRVYPARVKFRGFSSDCTSKAYKEISAYMAQNATDLLKEAEDE